MDKRVHENARAAPLLPHEEKMLLLNADEIMVFQRMILGYSDEEIAQKLLAYNISVNQVCAAVLRIYTKLGVRGVGDDAFRRKRAEDIWREYHTERKRRKPKRTHRSEKKSESQNGARRFGDDELKGILAAVMQKIPTLSVSDRKLMGCIVEDLDTFQITKKLAIKETSLKTKTSVFFTHTLGIPTSLSGKQKRLLVKAATLQKSDEVSVPQ